MKRRAFYHPETKEEADAPHFETKEDCGYHQVDIDGTKKWYLNNELHRLDGPVVIMSDGTKEWRIHGELHRTNGPARVYPNGNQAWYQKNQLHRIGGPAIDFKTKQEWWIHGKLHRPDGPAIIHLSCESYWYQDGHEVKSPFTETTHIRDELRNLLTDSLIAEILEETANIRELTLDSSQKV